MVEFKIEYEDAISVVTNGETTETLDLEEACRVLNFKEEELLYFKRRTVLSVAGWEFSAVSLYDEEGVEGWHWESPSGEDFYEIGDWNELVEIPEDVAKIADELINV